MFLRLLLLMIFAATAIPAQASVFLYFEVGGGKIYLAGRYTPDGVNWCSCATADETVAPDGADMNFCWLAKGDKIVFTNHRYQFEANLIDVQIEITPDTDREPYVLPERKSA